MNRILKYGLIGNDVLSIEKMLDKDFGYPDIVCDGTFDLRTFNALIHFQQTHIDEDGKFLKVDGIVGPKTLWALKNSHGIEQKNDYSSYIPDGTVGNSIDILQIALNEHALDVHEIPNGSNWGDGVKKYNGAPGWPWCCLFTSWVLEQVFNRHPLEKRMAACIEAWRMAKHLGMGYENPCYQIDNLENNRMVDIYPGNQYIMLHLDANGKLTGRGHTGFVLGVSPDYKYIYTVSGNEGNRVKIGKRKMNTIHGFIKYNYNNFEYERGNLTVSSTAGLGTR